MEKSEYASFNNESRGFTMKADGTEEDAFLDLMKLIEQEVTTTSVNIGTVHTITTADGKKIEHRFTWGGDYVGIAVTEP